MTTLKYDFAVVGARNVERAFSSIEQKAVRHNMRISRTFGGVGTARRAPNLAAAARVAETLKKKQTQQALKAEREIQREQKRTARYRETALKKQSRLELAAYRRRLAEEKKLKAANARAAATALRERRRASGALFGRIGSSARSATRAVGATAIGGLAIGGGLAMGSAMSQQVRETAMSSQLANPVGTTGVKG